MAQNFGDQCATIAHFGLRKPRVVTRRSEKCRWDSWADWYRTDRVRLVMPAFDALGRLCRALLENIHQE
jgi:hypothetical protein